MSFFDDDEPIRASRTRPAAPRRPAPGGSRGGGGRRPPPRGPDPATVRQRQLVLGGITLVVFLVLVFGVNSCRTSHRNNALKSYNRDVTKIAASSDGIGVQFFRVMNAARSTQAPDVQVNQLRQNASNLVNEAKGLDVPDQMARAQSDLELALNFRAEGLRKIAAKLPDAMITDRNQAAKAETAVEQIAGQMQQFLASDVVYSQRVVPEITSALAGADIKGQPIRGSRFLPSIVWLVTDNIAGKLGTARPGGGTGASPNPAPGTHGHGLTSTSVGSVTLSPGGTSLAKVPASPAPIFHVVFQNQGENDETDVVVVLRVSGGGRSPITRRKTIAMTKKGSTNAVDIPLGTKVTGSFTVSVTIEKVPGEMTVSNNKASYAVLFSN